MSERETVEISPQPGPQTMFLESNADIVFYGGGAGSGKTYALLLEPLRHFTNALFGGVIFRRTTTQVRNEGGLWDESVTLYGKLGCTPRESALEWYAGTGWRMKFAHLEYEKTVFDWQGAQIPFIGFDEITHFTEKQFFYMLSRNRSSSGVPGYIRGTCNPDVDSWVRRFISWWIDPATGLPIHERSGVVRWFIRQNDSIIWADSKEELITVYGVEQMPKSFTFIAALIYDNKILMEKDPNYLSNLHALSRVDRMRLLEGNWNVRTTAGSLFQRQWFKEVDAIPAGHHRVIRFWDRAASKPTAENPDPDFTRGLKLYCYPNGTFCVGDLRSTRDTPLNVETLIKQTAQMDGFAVEIVAQQDPGSAGVSEASHFTRMLHGYTVRTMPFSKDKITRAKPVSAQVEAGNIMVMKAPWNTEFYAELENFGEDGTGHDDIVDTLSGAYNEGIANANLFNLL